MRDFSYLLERRCDVGECKSEQWGSMEPVKRLLSLMTDLFLVLFQMKGARKVVDIIILWETLRIWHFPLPLCPAGWPGASLHLSVYNYIRVPKKFRQPALLPRCAGRHMLCPSVRWILTEVVKVHYPFLCSFPLQHVLCNSRSTLSATRFPNHTTGATKKLFGDSDVEVTDT